MIFQSLLVVVLFVIIVYAYFQLRSAPPVAISALLLAVLGLFFALAPEASNEIAKLVGIGRGADLIVYCFILTTFVAIFNLHLRFRAYEGRITAVVRELAILTASHPENEAR